MYPRLTIFKYRSVGNINIDLIESAINSKTKAIAIVHYLGAPVDMPKVMEIAKKHNLFVLEDCALSPGAKIDGIHTGLHGDAGVFSFYPVKHLTTAEGGMIILRDGDLAKKLTLLKAFGVDREHFFDNLETMASQALASGSPGNNPRIPDIAEMIELYKKLW